METRGPDVQIQTLLRFLEFGTSLDYRKFYISEQEDKQ